MQLRIYQSQSSRSSKCEEKDVEINTLRRAINKIHGDDKKIHGDENYTKEMMKMLVFVIIFLVIIFVVLMCILINKR